MASDRELLELAAKAAGITVGFSVPGGRPVLLDYSTERASHWNPLEEDGDALRLAVRLRISIQCPGGAVFADAYHTQSSDPVCVSVEMDLEDSAAACRRAIVRTAAEIGKSMP